MCPVGDGTATPPGFLGNTLQLRSENATYWQATGRAEVECSGLSNNLGILALSIQVFSKGTEEGALPRMDPFLASPDASCGWKNVGLGFLSFKGV